MTILFLTVVFTAKIDPREVVCRKGMIVKKEGAIESNRNTGMEICPKCGGKGYVNIPIAEHPSMERGDVKCAFCDGEGVVEKEIDVNYFKREKKQIDK